MMKVRTILGWLAACLSVTSCFKDESAMDVELFKPLVIHDFTMENIMYVVQGERLKASVLAYKEGTDDAKLAYEWRLEGNGQHLVLGNTMTLDTIITVPIHRDPYSLLFSVTDTNYDLRLTEKYNLYVTGDYVPGLLVADTRDEQTSDIHLLTSKNFTSDYTREEDEHVFRNIYSANNGAPINGLVTDIVGANGRSLLTQTIATEHSVELINALGEFTSLKKTEDLFILPFEEEITVGQLGISTIGPYEYVAVNGKIHKRMTDVAMPTFGDVVVMTDLTDNYYITKYYVELVNNSDLGGLLWDAQNQRFLAFSNLYFREGYLRIYQHTSADGKLDPNHPGDVDCKYIGKATNNTMYAVLQNNVNKQYEVWVFNKASNDSQDDVVLRRYMLDQCPEIGKALYFTCQPAEDILYYATENKMYAALMVSEHPNAYLKYEAPLGEKITEIKVVNKCVGTVEVPGTDGVEELSSSQNMFTVVTYNESTKEGKITVIPILSLNTGNMVMDKNYYRIYGGFGRILKTSCYHTR